MTYLDALTCFKVNLEQFVNAQTEPEKHNLYAGLLNLTQAIEKDMLVIKEELQRVRLALEKSSG
jgi:hypothetical protein